MTHKNPETLPEQPDFNGAAMINELGEEIPITEEMVQDACDQLENTKT